MANRFTEYKYDETQLTAVSGYWSSYPGPIVGFARRVVIGGEKSGFHFLDRLDLKGDHLCVCEMH